MPDQGPNAGTSTSLEPVRFEIIECLSRAAQDSRHALRTPTVTSVDEAGRPQARVMILRGFDASQMVLRFFTDARSPKVASWKHSPFVQLLFYDAGARVQMRASGRVRLHHRDQLTEKLWSTLPEFGHGDYLSRQPPGSDISDPGDSWQDDDFGSDNFMVVEIEITEIDWLRLSQAGHKRARLIWRDGKCEGRWIAP